MTAASQTTGSPAVTDEGTLGPLADDLARASLALARRFHAGGTMWCVSPTWPHHARHIAVEFVHPVIVGKRALPAVLVPNQDVVSTLRVSVNPGDVVIAVATADDRDVRAVMRRAPAWGVHTLWVGNGPRPEGGSADHVLWLEEDPLAPYNGRFVLLYHLLWELTHVCFEHRGLLEQETEADREVCVTCADEGVLAEVIAAGADQARVRTAEGQQTVGTALVGDVERDDLLLVHAGTAITRLDGGV